MAHLTRIMYIENKSAGSDLPGVQGPARIGRVVFSKSRQTVYYRDRTLMRYKGGFKYNHFDAETLEEYWVSGPRRDGEDGLYGARATSIDEDVREEYWTLIRRQPERKHEKFSC